MHIVYKNKNNINIWWFYFEFLIIVQNKINHPPNQPWFNILQWFMESDHTCVVYLLDFTWVFSSTTPLDETNNEQNEDQ